MNTITAPERRLDDALAALTALARGLAPRLPAFAALVCAIGAGFAAADLFWKVRAPAPGAPIALSATDVTSRADPAAAALALGRSQAFGRPDAAPTEVIDAPDSQLGLTLRGVIAAGDPAYSRAFIAGANGEERGYAVGGTVPGGATLQSVHPDRVVLARNGAYETLRLPRDAAAGVGGAVAPTPVEIADLRGAQQNPTRLLDWMRPVVATESATGRQLGYRVYPGRDPDRFSKLGLLPGDLVTAVNGQTLDDPSRSMELMRNLTGADNITLTIERDGAQRLVQIPILQ